MQSDKKEKQIWILVLNANVDNFVDFGNSGVETLIWSGCLHSNFCESLVDEIWHEETAIILKFGGVHIGGGGGGGGVRFDGKTRMHVFWNGKTGKWQ